MSPRDLALSAAGVLALAVVGLAVVLIRRERRRQQILQGLARKGGAR